MPAIFDVDAVVKFKDPQKDFGDFDSGGVEVGNSVKSGNGIAFFDIVMV